LVVKFKIIQMKIIIRSHKVFMSRHCLWDVS